MLIIHDSHHIPANRHRRDHTACRSGTGFFRGRREADRVRVELAFIRDRRLRFAWLVRQWSEHEARISLVKRENKL